jgi:hypothetical protein
VTSVPPDTGRSSCSNTILNSGILLTTVNDLFGSTDVTSIGTALPLVGTSRPLVPASKGPFKVASLVSGSQDCQVETSAYRRKMGSGPVGTTALDSTCMEGRVEFVLWVCEA